MTKNLKDWRKWKVWLAEFKLNWTQSESVKKVHNINLEEFSSSERAISNERKNEDLIKTKHYKWSTWV